MILNWEKLKPALLLLLLFAYNLSQAQVVLLKDIKTGTGQSFMEKPVVYNGKLYFQASGDNFSLSGIFESDGTAIGTTLFHGGLYTDELTAATSFLAWSGSPPSGTGSRIWRSNNGVVEYPGNTNIFCSTLFAYQNEVFFNGSTFSNGSELWKLKSTGSPEAVIEIPSSSTPSSLNPSRFTNHTDGSFYFLSWRINGSCSLWRSSGETANTFKIIDCPYTNEIFSAGNYIFFFTRDEAPLNSGLKQLWVSDGTIAGTHEIMDFGAGYPVTTQYAELNGKFYFFAPEADNTYELWESDGTAIGTVPLSNIDIDGGFPTFLGTVGNDLFFSAANSSLGPVLYKFNHLSSTVTLLKDINTVSTTSGEMGVGVQFLNKLYFTADDGINGIELWRTDGSSSGTELVADINPSGNSEINHLTVLGKRLIFVANDPIYGYEPRVYTDPMDPPCTADLNLTGESTEVLYTASSSLESTQVIPVSFRTFYTSPSIVLNPGFVTNNMAVFRAEPLGCD